MLMSPLLEREMGNSAGISELASHEHSAINKLLGMCRRDNVQGH